MLTYPPTIKVISLKILEEGDVYWSIDIQDIDRDKCCCICESIVDDESLNCVSIKFESLKLAESYCRYVLKAPYRIIPLN